MCNLCGQDGNNQKLFRLSTFCVAEVLRVGGGPAGAIRKGAAFILSTARSLTGALFLLILFLSGGEQAANELCGFLISPFRPEPPEEAI